MVKQFGLNTFKASRKYEDYLVNKIKVNDVRIPDCKLSDLESEILKELKRQEKENVF